MAILESGGRKILKKFDENFLVETTLYQLDSTKKIMFFNKQDENRDSETHASSLINSIVRKYTKTRLCYLSQTVIDKTINKRQVLTKYTQQSGF